MVRHEDVDKRLHRLLHVRQALVGREPVMLEPPALRHRPPPADVPADHLPAALAAWDDWWRDAVVLAALDQEIDPAGAPDAPAGARSTDPFTTSFPLWQVLADETARPSDHGGVANPDLRTVGDLVEQDTHRWVSEHLQAVRSAQHTGGLEGAPRGSVPWLVVRDVVVAAVPRHGALLLRRRPGRAHLPRDAARRLHRPAAIKCYNCLVLLYLLSLAHARGRPVHPRLQPDPRGAGRPGRGHGLAGGRPRRRCSGRPDAPPRPAGRQPRGRPVLLGRAREIAAERHSWISAGVEVLPGRALAPVLLARLAQARDVYEQVSSRGSGWKVDRATIKASLAGSGVEAEISRTAAAAPPREDELTTALADVMGSAASLGAGLLLTIDEVHLATKDELAGVAAVLQHAVTQRWPLVVVLAGLPGLRDPRRMVTYLERGEWHDVDLLSTADAREALTGPASAAGRPLDDDAADHLAAASGGYPYAVQVLGHHAWRVSAGADRIDLGHARTGDVAAQRDLASGLYSARWHDCSPREKEYLVALAGLMSEGQQVSGADVARVVGVEPQAVTYLRARLVAEGTVFTQGRSLRFAVPGMAAWIGEQDPG